MKKLLLPFMFLALLGCEKEDTGPKMGCQSGEIKATGQRVFIRCCTRDQHLAGDNVKSGGSASVKNYNRVRWTEINNCSDCHTLDYSAIN